MKRLLIYVVVALCVVSLPSVAHSAERSDRLKPTWVKSPPKPLGSGYYFKVVETDAGGNLETSRKHSQKNLINGIAREFNIEVSEEMQSTSTLNYNGGGGTNESIQESYTLNVQTHDGVVNISYERVDEYYEIRQVGGHEIFHLFTLYAVSRTSSVAEFDDFRISNRYGAGGTWRSLIIPGWGQFHKGEKVKGGAMLGGVAVLGIGAIYADNERASYSAMVSQTQNVNNKITYNNRANNMATVRNVCIGGAAILYIYNLVDATVSPGAKRVLVKRRSTTSVSPHVGIYGDVGLVASVRF